MERKTKSSQNSITVFRPEGDLDIFGIASMWERIAPMVREGGKSICIDLASVGDLDLSGMQALVLLARTQQQHGVGLSLRNLRQEWQERFDPIGLGSLSNLCEKGAP